MELMTHFYTPQSVGSRLSLSFRENFLEFRVREERFFEAVYIQLYILSLYDLINKDLFLFSIIFVIGRIYIKLAYAKMGKLIVYSSYLF